MGELTLVVATGELDVSTADELDRVLRAALPDDRPDRGLVLDLSHVGFMDCAALGILVGTRNRLGSRFWLADPSVPVRRLLTLTGTATAFSVLHDPRPGTVVDTGDGPHAGHASAAARLVPAARTPS